jgi:hypothetical protein
VGAPRTSVRESTSPHIFFSYMALMSELLEVEPSNFEEASQQQVWRDAMVEKYASIMKDDVWEVVPRSEGKSVIGSRWIYKIKHAIDGSVEKFKAHFVAKGFSQKEVIDYDETFSPVVRYTSIRVVISIATKMGWKIHHMDVKTTFLMALLRRRCTLSNQRVLRCMGGIPMYAG